MSMFLAGTNSEILTSVLTVITAIGDWFVTTMPKLSALFYSSENGLTFFGVLAVAGLGFSVIFLLVKVIQNFMHFRG